MSWKIKDMGDAILVVLDSEMGIQNATDFHPSVLPLAGAEVAVRVDAGATRSIHSSIMQILYALSQAVPDFAVAQTSEEFRAAEVRVGFSLTRNINTQSASKRP